MSQCLHSTATSTCWKCNIKFVVLFQFLNLTPPNINLNLSANCPCLTVRDHRCSHLYLVQIPLHFHWPLRPHRIPHWIPLTSFSLSHAFLPCTQYPPPAFSSISTFTQLRSLTRLSITQFSLSASTTTRQLQRFVKHTSRPTCTQFLHSTHAIEIFHPLITHTQTHTHTVAA